MSVRLTVDVSSLDGAVAALARLAAIDTGELMTSIAAIGESQTRRRIEEEKTGPDGTPWPANRAGTDLLLDTGQHLLGSVASGASGDEATWGASWEYAWVHQFGAVIKPKNGKALRFTTASGAFVVARQVTVPARPFVGISEENAAEILAIVTDAWGLA